MAVYPRVCGGTAQPKSHTMRRRGLSPRVRGNPFLKAGGKVTVGSIPACAGEPSGPSSSSSRWRVYPRVCGGTARSSNYFVPVEGLSPRVRGNHLESVVAGEVEGSIPACAGEPRAGTPDVPALRVYPRVCGGTLTKRADRLHQYGLSPRVRGNRNGGVVLRTSLGSIPACAGEPSTSWDGCSGSGVYPRVCGGTCAAPKGRTAMPGLSPRVRGNPLGALERAFLAGSIPACAGEPSRCSRSSRATRVYPRVCGGTDPAGSPVPVCQGLSPRVRGNRLSRRHDSALRGSIPACAGEPDRGRGERRPGGVYPRVCGGTATAMRGSPLATGLSPRVRGNRADGEARAECYGSIPACAGEPTFRQAMRWRSRVYPRVCGGTRTAISATACRGGLSPRVRGNL